MKIILFVGDVEAYGHEFMDQLKGQGFHCIVSQNADEIDQVGKQVERAILIFTDSKFAFRFLIENKWPDFPCLNVLYLPKVPIITADSQKKLNQVNLKVYHVAQKELLVEAINKFQSNLSDDSENEELEFSVHQELDKKP